MDLTFFPMDSQVCMLEMESYGYTMADLIYVWHDGINSVEVLLSIYEEGTKLALPAGEP